MRIECPHCRNQLNIVEIEQAGGVACPTCGSRIPMLDATVAYRRREVRQVGHFDLLEKVGTGQFGSVWRAKDTKLHRTVAVKIPRAAELDQLRRALFLREAQAAAMLEHPNIVKIHEVGETDETVFIVSQFIDGVTLLKQLRLQRPAYEVTARIIATVADAVHHAHEKGVIHRDLKPSNILLDANGQPHVADFGLAKLTTAEITITLSGEVLGTPAYMSPEQARGDSHEADRRSDVYSLGVVLYEMLTGQRPFEGSTSILLHQIQSVDPRSPRKIERDIPRDLETICLKALSKTPARRYATAKDLADDLRRFLTGESIVARRASSAERGVRWIRRNPVVTAIAMIALLSFSVAVFLGTSGSRSAASVYPPGSEVRVYPPLKVKLNTEPEGAEVIFFALDRDTGEVSEAIQAPTRSPVELELVPRDYLVVAHLPDGRFHEVFRLVPRNASDISGQYRHRYWRRESDNTLSLAKIVIPSKEVADGMTYFPGTERFEVGKHIQPQFPERTRKVAPFYLDIHEVTMRDYLRQNQNAPPLSQSGKKPLEPDDFPLTKIFFDEAVEYAEKIGKRLPTDFEYEFAATQGGKTLYPWGNAPPPADAWKLHSVSDPTFDETPTIPPVVGLFSNALEIVDPRSAPYPMTANLEWNPEFKLLLYYRGGAISAENRPTLLKVGAKYRSGANTIGPERLTSKETGFRCVRSENPRLKVEDFALPKDREN